MKQLLDNNPFHYLYLILFLGFFVPDDPVIARLRVEQVLYGLLLETAETTGL